MTTTTDTAALSREIVERLMDCGSADDEPVRDAYAFVYKVLSAQSVRIEAAEARVKELEAKGWERAAKWVDSRREAYDRENSQYDNETGMTEFSNSAAEEYSTELYDIAEGLRANIQPCGEAAEARVKELEPSVAEIKAQGRAEGVIFTANRMLAAWESGFIDDTPAMVLDISGAVLCALEFLPNAGEGEFKRDYADEVRSRIAAYLRAGRKE